MVSVRCSMSGRQVTEKLTFATFRNNEGHKRNKLRQRREVIDGRYVIGCFVGVLAGDGTKYVEWKRKFVLESADLSPSPEKITSLSTGSTLCSRLYNL